MIIKQNLINKSITSLENLLRSKVFIKLSDKVLSIMKNKVQEVSSWCYSTLMTIESYTEQDIKLYTMYELFYSFIWLMALTLVILTLWVWFSTSGQLKLLISLWDETLNRGPVTEYLNTWHVKKPGEASGIGSSFCICILHL
jgi:hypothetical protein